MKGPVTLILAATNPALGIGKNGTLPWRLKREMKFFRQVTEGSTVIMGRKTWESIPPKFRPLANRKNIVISRNAQSSFGDSVLGVTSVEEAFKSVDPAKPIFIIGGAQVYHASLPFADRILLTLVEDPNDNIECDTFFEFDREVWKRQPGSRLREVVGDKVELPEAVDELIDEDGYKYVFSLWEKIQS